MNINEIKKIIYEKVKKKGCFLEERKSNTTGSWYFKIFMSDKISLLFRISDHKTKKDIITLRVDHKISRDVVTRFVNNRCDDLKYRHLKSLLGIG